MTDRSILERVSSDYSADELHAIMAALVQCESDAVCEVVAVVIAHTPGGEHTIKVAVDADQDAQRVAAVLRHAADHAYGGCTRCRRANRKRGEHRAE